MNLSAYFDRIAYTGDTSPTWATLKQLHRAHLMHIPFENLSIHMPQRIILDEDWLFTKIVTEKRGGFCFEQNGLFYAVLKQLGYEVYRLEANVYHDGGDYGVLMNHMCLLIVIDGVRYLADVGFGASFIEPLLLDSSDIQVQDAGHFQIIFEGETGYYHTQGLSDDNMSIGYRFYLTPHTLADYNEACHYMQTSPETHFTQKRVCSQWTDNGRITLSDNKFITTDWDGIRTEIPVENEDHFHQLLDNYFGIAVKTVPPQMKPS
ncbi:MAG: arylamine N-acetyltransferase [Chloroflexota bacterium]